MTMAFSTLIALLQDAPAPDTGGAQNTIRIVAGVLALVLVAIIVMRRKGGRKKDEDEF
jgi:LPXTG-motif cell wall-anchored protein